MGSKTLTIEQEKELIADYNPILEYRNLDFKGYFKMDNLDVIEATSDSDGELVSLSLTNKIIKVDENFAVELSIATDSIKTGEVGSILNTKDKVAEAKILLFSKVIEKAVKDTITALKAKDNNFETEYESEEF
nr:MAG TPA: hypothetical protein [Caudoviricetes sp.]